MNSFDPRILLVLPIAVVGLTVGIVVLALPALLVFAGYAADSLIANYTGCGVGTIPHEVAAWPAVGRVGVLTVIEYLPAIALIVVYELGMVAALMLFMTGNERRHENAKLWLWYCLMGAGTTGGVLFLFSRMICIAT